MPKIVSNTTPLISLLKIDRLDLLRRVYGEIIVPKAVFNEIEKGKNKPYYVDLSQLDWIQILPVKNKVGLLYFLDLDQGEAEVIVLATEIGADLVIIDETLGRRFAKHANLRVTGTLGILVKAKQLGLVDAISPLLDAMQSQGIWIGERLKTSFLVTVNE